MVHSYYVSILQLVILVNLFADITKDLFIGLSKNAVVYMCFFLHTKLNINISINGFLLLGMLDSSHKLNHTQINTNLLQFMSQVNIIIIKIPFISVFLYNMTVCYLITIEHSRANAQVN